MRSCKDFDRDLNTYTYFLVSAIQSTVDSTATNVATKVVDGLSESTTAKNPATEDDADVQSTAERSINSVTCTKRSNWLKILWRNVFNSLFGRLLAPWKHSQ